MPLSFRDQAEMPHFVTIAKFLNTQDADALKLALDRLTCTRKHLYYGKEERHCALYYCDFSTTNT